MTYYVYVLFSSKKDCFYIGETEDVETRLKSHLSGISKFTARADDWKVVYTEQFQTRTEAIKREWANQPQVRILLTILNFFSFLPLIPFVRVNANSRKYF